MSAEQTTLLTALLAWVGLLFVIQIYFKLSGNRRRRPPPLEKTIYPRTLKYRGAKSSVTGGHPEDINQMPPDISPSDPNPVFDGSHLNSGLGKVHP